MAGLWCEDFERFASDTELLDGLFADFDAGWSLSTVNPGTGPQNIRGNGGACWRRIFGAAKPDGAGVAYRVFVDSLPIYETGFSGLVAVKLMGFMDASGTTQMVLVLGTDGAVVLWRGYNYKFVNGGGFTEIKRSDPCIQARAYNHIEAFCKAHNTDGVVEVRVNGVTVLTYNGDTQVSANQEVSQVWCQAPGSLSGTTYMDIDDLHAWDTDAGGQGPADFVGNCSVVNRAFNADTAQADFALSSGVSGYPLLNDNSDLTYITADTVGDASRFQAAAVSADVTGVIYQQINYRAKKDDSGDCNITLRFVQPGGSPLDYTDAVEHQLTTLETWRWGLVANDPATGMPFTPSGADSCEFEFVRTL